MDINTAKTLAKKLQISVDHVVREEYEMLLLKELYESKFASHLVFKGGTALRLAYGSPRFSDDLDFTAIGKFNGKEFVSFLRELPKRAPGVVSIEAIEKFHTAFALAKIKDAALAHPFSIKIEASKRADMSTGKAGLPGKQKERWVINKDYSDKPIASDVAVWRVIARVASLERILLEKEDAMKNRRAPRDLFDWWFINQALHREVTPDLSGYNKEHTKAELRRLLPKPQWRLIDLWLA